MLAVGLPLVLGLVHVALVAPHYFVGSFDDDAGYLLAARGLLRGAGLTGTLPSGDRIIGLYPPGYSALIAPLLWLWPHSFLPVRLLSAACYAAAFPLVWVWLRRRGVTPPVVTAGLVLMALGPPFATYGSMVMAEAPFLVVLLLLLLAVDTWRHQTAVVTAAGVRAVILAATLVWLKQAGLGLVVGLVLWLPFSRSPRRAAKAALVCGGLVAALLPVVVIRLSSGIPLAGARYSQELGGYYQGGLLKRLVDVVPASTVHLLATAIPATLVPYLQPLPITGAWAAIWSVVSWQVTILIAVGAVLWFARHRDAVIPMTVVYLAESVLWPFVNERRAILVLPVLIACYVTGASWAWAQGVGRLRTPRARAAWRGVWVLAGAALVAGPLVAQMPRDYLYGWGQSGSHFGGSRYAAILAALGPPTDVVETDYRQSTALYTGHATRWDAFIYNQGGFCYLPGVLAELRSDRAGFLLVGDLNKPGQIDNQCLASVAALAPWAVPLVHTRRDSASVYELIGPFSGHPGTADVLGSVDPTNTLGGGRTVRTWELRRPAAVSQVSVGVADRGGAPTTSVRVQLEQPDGAWQTVARSGRGVGDRAGETPFLLARMAPAVDAVGFRVVVDGPGPPVGAMINEVAVLGPAPAA